MCIKPQNGTSGVEDIVVQRKSSYINNRMPKNNQKDISQDKIPVVYKNVGSNGMQFELQGDEIEEIDVVREDIQVKEEYDVAPEPKMPTRLIKRVKRSNNTEKSSSHGNPGTAAFVSILLHCLKCRSCDQVSCKKMTMVLKHYQACRQRRLLSSIKTEAGHSPAPQNCKLCQQLLRIVAHHSKYLCKLQPGKQGCPVLMCDTFRIMGQSGSTPNNMQQPRMRRVNGTQAKA